MKLYLAACVAGIFVFDERNKIVYNRLFKKDPEEIAKALAELESGKLASDVKLPEGEIISDYPISGLKQEKPNPGSEYLRQNFRKLAVELKFVKDQAELNKLLTEVNIAKTKTKISVTEKRDKILIQAISALNDLDRIVNTMIERLREWYGFHYPELDVEHEKYAELVAKFGKRESIEGFESSMGMSLEDSDIEILKNYSKNVKELYNLRKSLEKYLEYAVVKETPNLNAMLGALLAARLLAAAGSLEKLAKMPSSTIQLLGAEKALFRFLREGKKKAPPKHGLLFLHPDITSAPKENRGKIARLLASKLTLAARADFYSKQNISQQLLEDYKKKLEEIKKEN